MDNVLKIVSKMMIYVTVLIVALVILLRGVVGTLWGSHSDFGVLAAPFAGAFGLVGILWLANKMYKDLSQDINQKD